MSHGGGSITVGDHENDCETIVILRTCMPFSMSILLGDTVYQRSCCYLLGIDFNRLNKHIFFFNYLLEVRLSVKSSLGAVVKAAHPLADQVQLVSRLAGIRQNFDQHHLCTRWDILTYDVHRDSNASVRLFDERCSLGWYATEEGDQENVQSLP